MNFSYLINKQANKVLMLAVFMSECVLADFNPQIKWSKPILLKKEAGVSIYEVGEVSNLIDTNENKARFSISGPIFTFNAYTFSGDQSDWYFRYGSLIKHSIFSCNISPKTISVFSVWNIQGAESWNHTWKTTFEANKCYYFSMNKIYQYTGYYSFVGAVYAKGYSSNFSNTDSSKFVIY